MSGENKKPTENLRFQLGKEERRETESEKIVAKCVRVCGLTRLWLMVFHFFFHVPFSWLDLHEDLKIKKCIFAWSLYVVGFYTFFVLGFRFLFFVFFFLGL